MQEDDDLEEYEEDGSAENHMVLYVVVNVVS